MTGELNIRNIPGGFEFEPIVKTRGRKSQLPGIHDGALRIETTAAPEKGKANEAIRRAVSRVMKVPVSNVEINSGSSSKRKRIRTPGVEAEILLSKLESLK